MAITQIKPQNNDLVISVTETRVNVYVVNANGKADLLAYSDTVCRSRFVRLWGADKTQPARDFTPRKLRDRKTAGYLIGKYFPHLIGRRIFDLHDNNRYLLRVTDKAPAKAAKKSPRTAREDMTMVPGAILVSSWGYEQTNIDFYEITERKGCFIWIEKVGQKREDGEFAMTGTCVPNTEHRTGKIIKKRLFMDEKDGVVRDREWVNLNSYAGASLWDGKKEDWTAYA